MENNQISLILTIVLVVLISVFAIMLIIYLTMLSKERARKKEQKRQEEANNKKEEEGIKQQSQHGNVLDFMEFEDIKDNMIIQKERQKYLMVIECQGVNYDLMSAVEKTGVEEGFLQFLNTLRHPIQLYVQTRSINLEKSIEKYKKYLRDVEVDYNRKKIAYQEMRKTQTIPEKQKQRAFFELTKAQNLYEYGKDIIRDTERLSLNKNILNKKYYIIIRYFYEKPSGDFHYETEEIRNMAFSDLYTKAQSLIRTLSGTGVNGRILDTIDLAELLYMAYNRDGAESYGIERALKASYDKLYSTAPDVFEKKIKALDKEIEEAATKKAQKHLKKAKTQREKEIERREKEKEKLINDMARIILEGNRKYIGKDLTDKAVNSLNEEIKNEEGGRTNEEKQKEQN